MADPAGGKNHGARPDELGAGGGAQLRAEHATAAALDEQARDRRTPQPGDPGARHGRVQRPGDLRTGGVATGVHDAVAVVPALAGHRQPVAVHPVEACAHGDEFGETQRPLFDQAGDRPRIAQRPARLDGVGSVKIRSVVGPDGRRDAALGPRCAALVPRPGVDDQHAARPGDTERRGEACDT